MKNILSIALVFSTFSCKFYTVNKVLYSGQLEASSTIEEISFIYDNYIFLHAALDDSISGWFILDTGSPSIIFYDKVNINKNILKNKVRMFSINSMSKIELSNDHSISIKNKNFKEIGFLLAKSPFDINTCLSVDPIGIIGTNILKLGAWQIDYQNQKIIIGDSINDLRYSENACKNYLYYEKSSNFNSLLFDITLPSDSSDKLSKRIDLLVDTGLDGEIFIDEKFSSSPFMIKSKISDTSHFSILIKGVNDEWELKNGFLSLHSNIFNIPNKAACLPAIDTFKIIFMENLRIVPFQRKGFVGNRFLERYKISISYPDHCVIYDPIKDYNQKRKYHYGIKLLHDEFNNVIVKNVDINPKSINNSKILLGKKIISINGSPAQENYCNYKKAIYETLEITYLHQNDTLNTSFPRLELFKY